NGYVGFALCPPTSIMPAGRNGTHAGRSSRFRGGKRGDGVPTCHHRLVLEHRRCLTYPTIPPRPPQGKCRLLLPEETRLRFREPQAPRHPRRRAPVLLLRQRWALVSSGVVALVVRVLAAEAEVRSHTYCCKSGR